MPEVNRTRTQWRIVSVFVLIVASLSCAAHAADTVTIGGKPPSTIAAGTAYAFTPTATDSAGKKLTYTVTNKPAWASFNSATGKLSGTPAAANVGKYSNIAISASDGTAYAMLWFSITVQAGSGGGGGSGGTLTITGSPPSSVSAGSAYSFTPTTTDAAGRTITFSVVNKPSWATFSAKNGQLSGTPATANVGTYSNIAIAASDGSTSALLWFSIKVNAAGGGSPTVTITGTPPASVAAGSGYSFTPTAKDSAGKTLSFSVTNKPSWATFSIATGQLSGTPPSAQTDASITISASDGTASAALAPFTISVTSAPASGSATLAWTDPTLNTNGSALTNLAGIHIYYGPSQSSMSSMVTVASTTQTSYTVTGLGTGTWYFGATAYTTSGTESAISQIGSKTIQ
ncbi:MAG: putative Ig domain-containing protein [Proteobacteria bacterium]|nr:putative Ig domain-containing protein [Pseudomonadota bacterium]